MRHLFPILIFFFVFENTLSKNELVKKISKAAKEMKNLINLNDEQTRKLNENTDSLIEPEEYNSTEPDQAESGNATAKDSTVDINKPVSVQGYENDKKDSQVQIMKFHSFQTESRKIHFGTFFYFFKKQIPYSVIFRLRITYNSRQRNLQEATADSVRSVCIITDETKAGLTINDGVNINYYCSANSAKDAKNAKIELNTDLDLALADKEGNKIDSLDFNEINFNGNASNEAKDIKENKEKLNGESQILKDTTVSKDNYIFKLFGTLTSSNSLRLLELHNKDKITMELNNKENGQETISKYDCTLNSVSAPSYELNCDTSSNPINTDVKQLHLSSGKSTDGTLLTVEMRNGLTNSTTLSTQRESYSKKKSSGGLSGGAIAGIVIACVVVLAAVSIAAILLRKPSRPMENSTVIQMSSDNI